MRTLTAGMGLSLISATLIDNYWLASSLLYPTLSVVYWMQHRAFLDQKVFDIVRAWVDSFLLVFVIGYSSTYYKRMMFLQAKLLEDSWLHFLQECPDPIVVVAKHRDSVFCNNPFVEVFAQEAPQTRITNEDAGFIRVNDSGTLFGNRLRRTSIRLKSFPRDALFCDDRLQSEHFSVDLDDLLAGGGFGSSLLDDHAYCFDAGRSKYWLSL